MKSKNIELAKLLGINPMFEVTTRYTNGIERQELQEFDEKDYWDNGFYSVIEGRNELAYPDFTKPDNFINLLKAWYHANNDNITLCGCANKNNPINDLLFDISYLLERSELTSGQKKIIKKLKTQIKKIQWIC